MEEPIEGSFGKVSIIKILKQKIKRNSNVVQPLIIIKFQKHFVFVNNDQFWELFSLNVTKLV
jgi:hypothetical protein